MPRWLWVATGTGSTMLLDLLGAEAVLGEPLAGAVLDQALGAGAGGHALGLDAGRVRVPRSEATAVPNRV